MLILLPSGRTVESDLLRRLWRAEVEGVTVESHACDVCDLSDEAAESRVGDLLEILNVFKNPRYKM
jgi:hypothetical protein